MTSTCIDLGTCLVAIAQKFISDGAWAKDVAIGAASPIVALLALIVTISIASAEGRRFARAERQKLRADLREWFAGLSLTEELPVVRAHRSLDSRIKEDIHGVGGWQVRWMMQWAYKMHQRTWAIERADAEKGEDAHARRMYAKWIFRDIVAEWAVHPYLVSPKIAWLRIRGYAILSTITIPFDDSENILDAERLKNSMRPFRATGPVDIRAIEQVQQRVLLADHPSVGAEVD